MGELLIFGTGAVVGGIAVFLFLVWLSRREMEH